MLPRPQYNELQLRTAQETIERRKRMHMHQLQHPCVSVSVDRSLPIQFVENRVLEIQKIVCDYLYIELGELTGESRLKRYVLPRHMAMLLCHEFTNNSTLAVAHRFNRDHTTMLYAVKKAQQLLTLDPMFYKVAEQLRELIKEKLKHRPELVVHAK